MSEVNIKDLASEDYKKGMKYKEIAEKYNIPYSTIKSWAVRYWKKESCNQEDKKVATNNKKLQPKKKGAPKGNKNATGPPGNKHAETHGLFTKYLPKETQDIIAGVTVMDPLDILWGNITIQYAAIIRAQQIMYVADHEDKTIERIEEKFGNVTGEKWEVQQAWDKQATFLQAQSRAMTALNGMIKSYDDLLHKNWDAASEEQKLRIKKLEAEISKITGEGAEIEDTTETDADIYGG